MREIDPSHVKETGFTCSLVINSMQKAACSFRMFERSCLRLHRLFMFIRHYAVICGMLTKVCRARINYLNLLVWFGVLGFNASATARVISRQ